jgi:spore coat protein U-like protein
LIINSLIKINKKGYIQMKYKNVIKATILSTLVTSSLVNAASTTNTFQVSAESAAYCRVASGPINFGSSSYLPSSPEINKTAVVVVTCTKDLSWSIKVNGGLNYDGTDRFMVNSKNTDKIKYTMSYLSNPIGVDTPFATKISAGTLSMSLGIKIPAGQNIYADNYSDQITFSIDY